MTELEPVNSLEDTADYLKVSPPVLLRMAKNRQIGSLKQGAKWTFPKAVIETYIENRTTPQVIQHPSGMTEQSLRRIRAGL